MINLGDTVMTDKSVVRKILLRFLLLSCIVSSGCLSTGKSSGNLHVGDGTGDGTVSRLVRENDELKTTVDALKEKVLKLDRLLDEQQVKLDYLAEKMQTLESGGFAPSVSTSGRTPAPVDKPETQVAKPLSPTKRSESRQTEPPTVTKADVDPLKLYDEALLDYRAERYQNAIIKFRELLTFFPENSRASNSQYWIGECFYSLGEYKNAFDAFQLVLQKYPVSSKIPDALLKKGLCLVQLGNLELAEVDFQQVIDQFPSTTAANVAQSKIDAIRMN